MKSILLGICLILTISLYSQTLLHNVHEPYRLQMISPSEAVSGIVYHVETGIDGDCEIKLLLDSGYTCLLNSCNIAKKSGCLVAEIVCAGKSMFMNCKDYFNSITIPKKGDHILVIGPYVYDKRHKWMEIHPVEKLFFLK